MKNEVEFNITTYCQAKCPTCARTLELDKIKLSHTPIELFEKVVNNLADDVDRIILCGELGDPMMHPDIDKIIDIAHSTGRFVQIHTNGGLRNSNFYKFLAEKYERLGFSFGIDGLSQKINEIYRVDVDWKRAWENMTTWFEQSTKDAINWSHRHRRGEWQFLVFSWNKHELNDVLRIAETMNIPLMVRVNRRDLGYVGDTERERIEKILYERKNKYI